MTIGVFDSGLGGITVLAESLKRLPTQDYLYMADTLHVPYGTKSKDEVKGYILDAVQTMVHEGIEALVVACNTATSIAVSELRENYSIPIIGMEPAVKTAVEMNHATGKRVLVFATPLTLQQPKYYALVSRVDEGGIVDSLPLPELVEYCEELQFDRRIIGDYFRAQLTGYDMEDYGIIVLGCTHYSFYMNILRDLLPSHVQIVDGNAGTVKRLAALLNHYGIPEDAGTGKVKFMCTSGDLAYVEKMKQGLGMMR